MKRVLATLTLLTFLFLPTACQNSFPFGHSATAPTPPANPLSVAITVVSAAFPAAVTIRPGGSVLFFEAGGFDHMIEMDNGSGACDTSTILPTLASVTITFPSAGTFNYKDPWYGGYCSDGYCMPPCFNVNGTVIVE